MTVKVKNLSKNYGKKKVLDDISFEARTEKLKYAVRENCERLPIYI
jgi:ABC-type multidrug transport system ATPase subunit